MKIVVVGGTGLIGSKLVTQLCQLGHEVLGTSRDSGVNTITGRGLVAALEGAEVVVNVVNSPSFEDMTALKFFERSSLNLRSAEAVNAVQHHVALSVVGSDRLPDSGYFRAKMAQEELIRSSGIRYTILRFTQCFEFIGRIAQTSSDGPTVHVSPALVQPIVSDDVVDALADVSIGTPTNATREVAGPEKLRLDELVRSVLVAKRDARQVTTDIHALYLGAELDDQSLTPGPNARIAPTRFDAWLRRATPPHHGASL